MSTIRFCAAIITLLSMSISAHAGWSAIDPPFGTYTLYRPSPLDTSISTGVGFNGNRADVGPGVSIQSENYSHTVSDTFTLKFVTDPGWHFTGLNIHFGYGWSNGQTSTSGGIQATITDLNGSIVSTDSHSYSTPDWYIGGGTTNPTGSGNTLTVPEDVFFVTLYNWVRLSSFQNSVGSVGIDPIQFSVQAAQGEAVPTLPEPASALLVALGILPVWLRRRAKSKN